MPGASYTPGLDYIVATIDALLLKLRLGDETTDAALVGVSIGSPEGVVVGSPGDIRIAIPGEVGAAVGLWQKETGVLTEDGWVEISGGGGGGGANPNDAFVIFAPAADLPNARVLTAGTNISIDLTTPGQVIINAAVTLQAAIDGQGTTPTEQTITTSIDLNAGTGQWLWRDAGDNNLMSISDVTGVTVDQAFAYTGDISPAALAAGSTADYAPAGLATATVLRLTPNGAGSTLTGLTTGSDGRRIFIFNISTTADLTLLHDDGASSAAANRFLCPNNVSVIIPPNGGVSLVYDNTTTRWRVVTPQQQSAFFQPASQSTVGAVVATFPIADLPNPGDRILVRGLLVSAIFTAGVAAGNIGQIAGTLDIQAQNSTADAVVVTFATQPWGPPPTAILQPTSTGYQPPLAFGSPGGVAVAVVVAGTQVQIQCTGIGGFTIRFDVLGELFLFGTSARLVQ